MLQVLQLFVSKPGMAIEEEVWLHDLNNLGADIGGYAGIFLGISCLQLYDIILKFINKKKP